MKFGLHYLLSCADSQSPVRRYRETLEQATRAEDLGFESVWPVEQHFDRLASIMPCPALLLSAIAARTRTRPFRPCVGVALARLETRIAFSMLLDRFPSMRLDPERRPVFSVYVNET